MVPAALEQSRLCDTSTRATQHSLQGSCGAAEGSQRAQHRNKAAGFSEEERTRKMARRGAFPSPINISTSGAVEGSCTRLAPGRLSCSLRALLYPIKPQCTSACHSCCCFPPALQSCQSLLQRWLGLENTLIPGEDGVSRSQLMCTGEAAGGNLHCVNESGAAAQPQPRRGDKVGGSEGRSLVG